MFFIGWFSEPGEMRPANGRSLDGAVVAEIVYLDTNLKPLNLVEFETNYRACTPII